MAWDSLNDMPWLGQPASFGNSIAKGAQAGSMIAHSWLAGQAQANDNERLRMEAARVQREEAMAPLKAQILDLTLQDKSLDIANGLLRQKDAVIEKEGEAALGRWAHGVTNWADPQVHSDALGFLEQYPQLARNPVYQKVLVESSIAQEARAAADMAKATAKSQASAPTFIEDPETGVRYIVQANGSLHPSGINPKFSTQAQDVVGPDLLPTGQKAIPTRTGLKILPQDASTMTPRAVDVLNDSGQPTGQKMIFDGKVWKIQKAEPTAPVMIDVHDEAGNPSGQKAILSNGKVIIPKQSDLQGLISALSEAKPAAKPTESPKATRKYNPKTGRIE